MGTEKRERQKAGRAARVEAAVAEQKKAENRRRIAWVVGTIAFVAVVLVVLALVRNDDDSSTDTASGDSTTSTTFAPQPESAAGKDCVALADPLPAGAPEVPVVPGPPPTDLQITDITEGSGEPVPAGATVTVDYIGVACSTGKIFDSSYSRGQPASFPLDGVIPGWTEGIPGMKVGGQRLLVIPPAEGYGDTGAGADIAPGETLWFVVTMNEFEPAGTTPSS